MTGSGSGGKCSLGAGVSESQHVLEEGLAPVGASLFPWVCLSEAVRLSVCQPLPPPQHFHLS